MEQYVNDRPYVASSFLSVAIAQVFGSALNGHSKDRPTLAETSITLQAKLTALPCRGGEFLLRKLFEPLGYTLTVQNTPLEVGYFSVHSALDSLVQNLRNHKERIYTRLWFAEELHWAVAYREALDILDAVLAEHPNHLRALTLQADIYNHQKRYDDAHRVAESVIALDTTYGEAWLVLADAYESLEDWNLLLATASRAMTLYEAEFTYWTNMLEARARAHLHLGQFDEFEADIARYPRPESTFAQRRIAKLRQEMATVKAAMSAACSTPP